MELEKRVHFSCIKVEFLLTVECKRLQGNNVNKVGKVLKRLVFGENLRYNYESLRSEW